MLKRTPVCTFLIELEFTCQRAQRKLPSWAGDSQAAPRLRPQGEWMDLYYITIFKKKIHYISTGREPISQMHAVIILLTVVAASVIHLNLHIRCVSSQSKTSRPIQSNHLPLLSWFPLFSQLYIKGGEGVAVMRYHVGRVMKPETNTAANQRRRKSRACRALHMLPLHTHLSAHTTRPAADFHCRWLFGDCFHTKYISHHHSLKRFEFYVFNSHKVEAMCWFQPRFAARGCGSPPVGTILWQAR